MGLSVLLPFFSLHDISVSWFLPATCRGHLHDPVTSRGNKKVPTFCRLSQKDHRHQTSGKRDVESRVRMKQVVHTLDHSLFSQTHCDSHRPRQLQEGDCLDGQSRAPKTRYRVVLQSGFILASVPLIRIGNSDRSSN
jgi:Sec7-like guanine-nucleotide exchange factor